MKIVDLGVLEGDVVVFGGIYSNLAALDVFLAATRDVPAEAMICTGDVVAYCARGAACVAALRARGGPVLAGNCERQIADAAPDCGCGYDAGSVCSLLSRAWYAHALATIGPADRGWMAGLPDRMTFVAHGKRWAVVHGAASDISAFVWPVTDDARIATEIALLERQVGPLDGVIAGHSGIPMSREVGGVTWFNPGALGMPAHDGSAQVRFGVLRPDGPVVKHLTYDAGPEIAAMRAAGLTQGYDSALATGWWPSEDSLPQSMRRS